MAEQVLREMNLSSDEFSRLKTCMKDPKFMELLSEYAKEISQPGSKEEAEAYLKMAEERSSFSMEGKDLIIPVAGYCLKTKNKKNNKKVFINICHTTNIDKPTSFTHSGKGEQWSIPYSLGPARNDVDKAGGECEVYDFVVNEEAHERAMKNNRFKRFLSETAIENVQKQRGVELSEEFILPKLKYKGQSGNPKMQTVRKASASEQANTEKEVSSKSRAGEKPSSASSSDSVPDVKELASKEVKPSFEFIYRDDLDLGKFWTDKAVLPNGNQKPKMIVLRVDLPEVQTSSEVELDVMKSDVSLYVPEKYKLKVQTAHPVDFKNARAQFDKNKRRLEVVMPTC
ncbi:hypothetical protein SELMODRAFT_406682 [Selaginella moellendorffii]|uniref:PIH1 domain-containing protein 1 n=2 Tax=Selaginella moellendorffii TaxID=88036 RepID=D8R143_SELML|nr:hypothetical protein SELMODRAFT_406682 [Selaginella moellendorffii]